MFLLHRVHTSAAYDPPFGSLNVLQRITRPQHTGTHIVEALSAAMGALAGINLTDYTLESACGFRCLGGLKSGLLAPGPE